MAKEINIHLKATGADQTKQDLAETAQASQKMGTAVADTGEKAKQGGKDIGGMGDGIAELTAAATGGIEKLALALGAGGLVAALAAAGSEMRAFFDELEKRSAAAVGKMMETRKVFADLFEPKGAYSEAERAGILKRNSALYMKTGIDPESGVAVSAEYARQYQDLVDSKQITQEQYNQGEEELLKYSVLHGGGATPGIVRMARSLGIMPQKMGEFTRKISANSQKFRITDEEYAAALERAAPAAQTLGWNENELMLNVGQLAAGGQGREISAMPVSTISAWASPADDARRKLHLPPNATAAEIKAAVQAQRQVLSQDKFNKLVSDIYGPGAVAGTNKAMGGNDAEIRKLMDDAAGPEGEAQANKEFTDYRGTAEYIDNNQKNFINYLRYQGTDAQLKKFIKDVGAAYKENVLQIKEPISDTLLGWYLPDSKELEYDAWRAWRDTLPEEEQHLPGNELVNWRQKSPREQFNLIRTTPIVNNYYGNTTNFSYGKGESGPQSSPPP